jgi:VanZ family protein
MLRPIKNLLANNSFLLWLKYNTLLHAITWTVIVTALCLLPGKDMPEVNIVNFDKLGHFCVFGLLNFLFLRHYYVKISSFSFQLKSALIITLLVIAYSGLMEIFQGLFYVDRSADVYDFVANSLGSISSLGLASKLFSGHK